jgi:hypothetical protein
MVAFLLLVIAAVLFLVEAIRARWSLTALGLCLLAVAFAVSAYPGAG